jgi:hypothetical protein
MKRLILILAVALSGCALILPQPHDPVMFGYLVDTKIAVHSLSCENKDFSWLSAEMNIEKLRVYTSLRDDPQADAIAKLEEAIRKARESKSIPFCESVLKLNKTRIDVVADAWKGRK